MQPKKHTEERHIMLLLLLVNKPIRGVVSDSEQKRDRIGVLISFGSQNTSVGI